MQKTHEKNTDHTGHAMSCLFFPAQVLGDDWFLSTCVESILCPDDMKTLDKLDGRNGPCLKKGW